MSKDLNILSFNANGLADRKKRLDVFDFLKNKNPNIVLLQETHWTNSLENVIRSEWGYECIVNGIVSNKNGVAILFCNNFEYTLHNVMKCPNGSYIILDITLLKKRVTLVNVYGPSGTDSQTFFELFFDRIGNVENENIVIAGDINVALDPKIDTFRYIGQNKPNARKKICEKMFLLNLIDVWRELNPSKRQYTWRKFNSNKQGRLDYFLISKILMPNIANTNISPGYRSDHSIISLKFKGYIPKRDRSFWKFNNSLLRDQTYVNDVKNVIKKTKQQYSALTYMQDNIDNIKNEDLHLTINDQLFFEVLLMEIRGKTISYSTFKKKEENIREKNLIHDIEILENDITNNNIDTLESKKSELELLRQTKLDGMLIRSKAQYIEEGEKNSTYFSSLEKRNYIEKSIVLIEREDNSIITEPDLIKTEVKSFYENLYSSRESSLVNTDLNALITDCPKLDDSERDALEGEITCSEALSALKKMQSDKSPGSSGYTSEFFKFFWVDLGMFLVRSINYGFKTGKLSITQRQGVITCIPKEGKEKRYLGNWRPITLLNTSYKIASACIAFRIKNVLPNIIHGDQTGFLAGRYIGENIRLLYDVLYHTEENNIPGQILLIDFFKAFDSVAWSFIEKCLDFFNFGEMIKQWIKTFYTDISSCVNVNGGYTSWFDIKTGCRQGDPSSPYLFLICAEILSQLIRTNKKIKGIQMNKDLTILLSQFADDTSLYLDGSELSFNESIKTLQFFETISGLKLNLNKTQVVWIGSTKNSTKRYLPEMNFIWNPPVFKTLGMLFSTNLATIIDLNFEGKLVEVERALNMWSKRYLTPYGKITVIKTQIISKLVYLLINIPNPSQIFVKQLDNLLFEFLWNKKPSRIKRQVTCAPYSKGGLNMIDLYAFIASMKISWVKRLLTSKTRISLILKSFIPELDQIPLMGGEIISTGKLNPFWKDVFDHYKEFHPKSKPMSNAEFMLECIHNNANITRGHQVIDLKEWKRCHIFQVKDITNNQGQLMDYLEFKTKYPILKTDFLTYNGIKNAINSFKLKSTIHIIGKTDNEYCNAWTSILKGNKSVYNMLLQQKISYPTSKEKWEVIFQFKNINWKSIYIFTNKILDPHLRWFEMRILHRILPTQKLLHSMGFADSADCTFCQQETETLIHLFYECPIVQRFWNDFNNLLNTSCPHSPSLILRNDAIIFTSINNFDPILKQILTIAKYYVFRCKVNKCIPQVNSFKNILAQRYLIDKYRNDSTENSKNGLFEIWVNYKPLFENQ